MRLLKKITQTANIEKKDWKTEIKFLQCPIRILKYVAHKYKSQPAELMLNQKRISTYRKSPHT